MGSGPLAQRLVAAGERVLDVPAKLAARARVFDTGQGRKTDAAYAHAIVRSRCGTGDLSILQFPLASWSPSSQEARVPAVGPVASKHLLIRAYHVPFPGIGTMTGHGDAYRWQLRRDLSLLAVPDRARQFTGRTRSHRQKRSRGLAGWGGWLSFPGGGPVGD